MSRTIYYIKVIDCSSPGVWYENFIGEEFEAYFNKPRKKYEVRAHSHFISPQDVELLKTGSIDEHHVCNMNWQPKPKPELQPAFKNEASTV